MTRDEMLKELQWVSTEIRSEYDTRHVYPRLDAVIAALRTPAVTSPHADALVEAQHRAERAEGRLREISDLLADAGVPGGTTIYGGVMMLRERAERAESSLCAPAVTGEAERPATTDAMLAQKVERLHQFIYSASGSGENEAHATIREVLALLASLAAPPAAGAPPADEAIAREIMTLLVPLVSDAAIVGRTYGWAEVLDIVRAVAVKFAGAPPALVALDIPTLLQQAKRFGLLAEQFVGPMPPTWTKRRAERDEAVHALRAAEKLLIGLVEKQRAWSPAPAPVAPPEKIIEPCGRCGHSIEDHIGSACIQHCRHPGCSCAHWQRPAPVAPPGDDEYRPNCDNGECRDHYGDELAWCKKCRASLAPAPVAPPAGDRDATCAWNCARPYPHDGPCSPAPPAVAGGDAPPEIQVGDDVTANSFPDVYNVSDSELATYWNTLQRGRVDSIKRVIWRRRQEGQ